MMPQMQRKLHSIFQSGAGHCVGLQGIKNAEFFLAHFVQTRSLSLFDYYAL